MAIEQDVASLDVSVYFTVLMEIAQAMDRLSEDRCDDSLITNACSACLCLCDVHDVCACACIDDLHDDPKVVGTHKGDVLAHDVSVTKYIHNSALPTKLAHR